jgi:transposase
MQYSADTKHTILLEYKPGVKGCGFKSLACRFGVKGGHNVIKSWYLEWDGTKESLEKHTTSHKRRKLDEEDIDKYITSYVEEMNESGEPVNYKDVQQNVESNKRQHVPMRSIQKYGKQAGLTYKHTTRTLEREGKHTHVSHSNSCLVFF